MTATAPQTLPTMPTYRKATCRRCNGSGQHSNYGGDTRCFGCNGTGVVEVEAGQRAMTDDERADWIDGLIGQAHRMDRERDRAARRAARMAA